MKRWLFLLLLLVSSSGCMMLDDLLYLDDAPPWHTHSTVEPPTGTCNQPIRSVSAMQTAEPDLLKR